MFGLLGLTYNPRGSISYIWGAEMLPVKNRLFFNSILCMTSGMVTFLVPTYFYYVGSQTLLFYFIIGLMGLATAIVYFCLPETPSFLLSQGDTSAYKKCMLKMTNIDVGNLEMASDSKNKQKKEKAGFMKLWRNSRHR